METYFITPNKDNCINQLGYVEENFGSFDVLTSVDDLIRREPDVFAVIIDNHSSHIIDADLKKLRRHNQYFLTPVFLLGGADEETLSDGILTDLNEPKHTALDIHDYISQINIYQFDWRSKLLFYLYTRPHLTLKAKHDVQQQGYYYYPLVQLFNHEADDSWIWLTELMQQKLLSAITHVDQLFCCTYCSSAHLKFTEHCPSCNTFNIQSTDFLHCFTCGNIAPQDEFMQDDKLVCHKCNSSLRYIGDDYDRPLESGLCLECGELYMDSSLRVTCMHCEKKFTPDRLSNKKIFELKLTDEGRKKIQFNTVNETVPVVDSSNFTSEDFFFATLDWLINIQKSHQTEKFCILGTYLPLLSENDLSLGYDLVQELKLILRKYDVIARLNQDYIWIILPKTAKENATHVMQRIQSFISSIDTEDTSSDVIKYKLFYSGDESLDNINAHTLISNLLREL
ncbi:MAG: hypothetical protein CMF50_05140 [Legionellales bacterium]|nr:hypothetical protein [Legionellales bacterium]|tara:strand:- start:76872 stop:78233 length:1362 start_codon:yes stop_codon:yes gene_type:complete